MRLCALALTGLAKHPTSAKMLSRQNFGPILKCVGVEEVEAAVAVGVAVLAAQGDGVEADVHWRAAEVQRSRRIRAVWLLSHARRRARSAALLLTARLDAHIKRRRRMAQEQKMPTRMHRMRDRR